MVLNGCCEGPEHECCHYIAPDQCFEGPPRRRVVIIKNRDYEGGRKMLWAASKGYIGLTKFNDRPETVVMMGRTWGLRSRGQAL